MNLTFQKHPAEVFCKKGALKNFANFTGKTVVLDSLLKKFADPRTFNFIKKRLKHSCFSVKSEKFLRTPILKNICERLLLSFGVQAINNFRKKFDKVLNTRLIKIMKYILTIS